MLDWIAANAVNLIVGAMIIVALVFAVRSHLKQRRGGGCAGCPRARDCHTRQNSPGCKKE